MEVCLFNEICHDGHDLFEEVTATNRSFKCSFNRGGFLNLQKILMEPIVESPDAMKCTKQVMDLQLGRG